MTSQSRPERGSTHGSAFFESSILELGMSLIEKMSSADFEPERYADEYRERALAMIEKKVEGQEIKAVAPAPRRTGQVVDIFAALKKSLETAGQQKSQTADRGKRKRKA
jgi:DNA end-binding protein Ku